MVIVNIYIEKMYINTLVFRVEQYVFGDSIGEEGGLGNFQVLREVIAISGKYDDYIKEIQASHKLGYPAYRIAYEGSTNFLFSYGNKVFFLGAHLQHVDELTSISVTKTHYLAYWKEDSTGGNVISIKGDRGIQGKRRATGGAGPIGPHGPKEDRGDIGPSGGAGIKGGRDGAGPYGPKGKSVVVGVQGEKGNVGSRGPKVELDVQ